MNLLLSPFSLLLVFFSCIAQSAKNDRQLRKAVNCEMLKDGNYVWDCSSYYSICTNGRELPMECYSGLKLNTNTNQCDAPSEVEQCHKKGGGVGSKSNVLYRAADPFNCQEYPDGDYEASACATKFYSCVKGQKLDKNCPPGLVFNSNTRACNFASKCRKQPYKAEKVYERATDDGAEMRADSDGDDANDKKGANKATNKKSDQLKGGKKAKSDQKARAEEEEKQSKSSTADQSKPKTVISGSSKKRKPGEEKQQTRSASDQKEAAAAAAKLDGEKGTTTDQPKQQEKSKQQGAKKDDGSSSSSSPADQTSGAKGGGTKKDGGVRKRRSIGSYLPPPSRHHFPPTSSASNLANQKQQQQNSGTGGDHYTIFNLYFPNHPKFNVVRSGQELRGVSSSAEKTNHQSSTDDHSPTSMKPMKPMASQQMLPEKMDNAPTTDELVKEFLEIDGIADALIDAIKDL